MTQFFYKSTEGKNSIKSTEGAMLKDRLRVTAPTPTELKAVATLEACRPKAQRDFDQIPMLGKDLLRQVKIIAPYLANKSVVFMGDNDGTSMLLGMLARHGQPCPGKMLLVDFDERILTVARQLALRHGFADRLEVRLYNAFDIVPIDLVGQYDWFYTNPPYGSRNNGESGRLFIARGIEMVRNGGSGCIILPDDCTRPWTDTAMCATQNFLSRENWLVREKITQLHQYHLDDDKNLASSMMTVEHVAAGSNKYNPLHLYRGHQIGFDEIQFFYGSTVVAPYPRYILQDGTRDYNWKIRPGA